MTIENLAPKIDLRNLNLEKSFLIFVSPSPWLLNVLIINSWPDCMKGSKEFRALGIKEGGERVADVTRIIT